MVVGDFAAVRYPVNIRLAQAAFPERHVVPQPQDQGGGGCLHILGQILAISTGIGRQLFLIEGLQVIKGLLGGVAVDTVTFPLQGRQIIEVGRLYGLCLFFYRKDRSRLPVTFPADRLCRLFYCLSFTGSSKTAASDLRYIEGPAGKCLNLCLTLHQKRQRWGHDAPDI